MKLLLIFFNVLKLKLQQHETSTWIKNNKITMFLLIKVLKLLMEFKQQRNITVNFCLSTGGIR